MELVILLAGCILAQLTRRLVLEWAEFKFLFLTFANASVIKALIAVFYFTLMPNKYPDYLYLLRFFDNLFSITFTIVIIFGHKVRCGLFSPLLFLCEVCLFHLFLRRSP